MKWYTLQVLPEVSALHSRSRNAPKELIPREHIFGCYMWLSTSHCLRWHYPASWVVANGLAVC